MSSGVEFLLFAFVAMWLARALFGWLGLVTLLGTVVYFLVRAS